MRGPPLPDHAPLHLAEPSLEVTEEADGCIILRQSNDDLGPVPRGLGQWLRSHERRQPERIALVAGDGPRGTVRRLRYGDAGRMVEAIAQSLLDTGLEEGRPLLVFARGGVEAFCLTFAGYLAGVPLALADPALLNRRFDADRLAQLVALLQPGMIHYADRVSAGPAFAALALPRSIRVTTGAEDFTRLVSHPVRDDLAKAMQRLHPDRIARILVEERPEQPPRLLAFSHRALARQAQALVAIWPFLASPACTGIALPTDWSRGDTGMALLHLAVLLGLPIHCGHPRQAARGQAGVLAARPDDLAAWADAPDADLRLSEAQALISLGGAIPADAEDRLGRIALGARGDIPPTLALWGPPESGGSCFATHWPSPVEGSVGLPVPGMTARLVPSPATGLFALDLAGAGMAAGLWTDGRVDAFPLDADGYFETKPAVEAAWPGDWMQGLRFAGRFA